MCNTCEWYMLMIFICTPKQIYSAMMLNIHLMINSKMKYACLMFQRLERSWSSGIPKQMYSAMMLNIHWIINNKIKYACLMFQRLEATLIYKNSQTNIQWMTIKNLSSIYTDEIILIIIRNSWQNHENASNVRNYFHQSSKIMKHKGMLICSYWLACYIYIID